MRVVGTAVIARVDLLKLFFSIDLSNCYSYNHVIITHMIANSTKTMQTGIEARFGTERL